MRAKLFLGLVLAGAFLPFFSSWAQAPGDPFDVIPYRDPQPLQALVNLDENQFRNLLAENNGARFRSIVNGYVPPGTTVFPISHGFAGTQEACLRALLPQACRLYARDVLAINREKERRGGVTLNPFVPAAQ